MKVSYGCVVPKPKRKHSMEEYQYVVDFNTNEKHKTMCFNYENEKQARNKMNSLRNIIKKEEMKIKIVCRENEVYLVKE